MATLSSLLADLVGGKGGGTQLATAHKSPVSGSTSVTFGGKQVVATKTTGMDIRDGARVILTRTDSGGYVITGVTSGAKVKTKRIQIDG